MTSIPKGRKPLTEPHVQLIKLLAQVAVAELLHDTEDHIEVLEGTHVVEQKLTRQVEVLT